jgi:hypothetical protein
MAPAGEFAPPPYIEQVVQKYGREASELSVEITGPQSDLELRLD